MRRTVRVVTAVAAAVLAMGSQGIAQRELDAAAVNRTLGRGVNLGNALEAPREGEWGMVLKEEYFGLIRRAGFQSVRVPIRWSAHAGKDGAATIDPEFFRRVDWVIDQSERQGLAAVINVHHYEEVYKEPDAHEARLAALWRQIAERYRARPERVVFEILNEPNGPLTDERWGRMFPKVLAAIRRSNPRRAVIVGPGNWNNVNNLEKLRLPSGDPMLIGTFHYYLPFPFTHQGAEWVEGSEKWLGTTWKATPQETEALRKDFEKAARWAREQRRPVYLGEFGAYSKADMDSRVRWTSAVAREAERHGMAWGYWEFGAGFGVYDRERSAWRQPLLAALIPAGAARP